MSDSFFGYKGGNTQFSNDKDSLKDGESITVIVLKKGFSATYLKKVDEENFAAKAEAESFLQDFTPKQPTYKEGGICYDIAVILRGRESDEPYEKIFIEDGDSFRRPAFNPFSKIYILPPNQYMGKMIFPAGGSERKRGEGPIIIKNFLPSSFPLHDKENFSVTADNIPEGMEKDYAELIKDESVRKEQWKLLISNWKQLSDAQAEDQLENLMSRVCFACEENPDKTKNNDIDYVYHKLEPGMILQGKVRYRGDSKFFNIEYQRWSKEKRKFEFFCTLDTKVPDEELKEYAEALLNYREEYFAKKNTGEVTRIHQEPDADTEDGDDEDDI